MASIPGSDSLYFIVTTGMLLYASRNIPVFVFARSRGLDHPWIGLVPTLEVFVLMASVGVPRRVILAFLGALGLASLGLLGLFIWQRGWTADWAELETRILLTPDIILFLLWSAACQDARISRRWALLAAWPYVGGFGAWRILTAVRAKIETSTRPPSNGLRNTA